MLPNWLRDAFKLDTAYGNPSNIRGRHWLIAALGYFLGVTLAAPGWGQSSRLERVTVSLPSGSVAFPLELAKRIGADTAEGLSLRLKFVNGGGVAISDLITGNADFGVFGLPAAMLYNLKQPSLVALAAIDGLPLYSLVIRADLRGKISRIEDLKGLKVGIHSDSLAATTTSRQILNLVLRNRGILPSEISHVPAGQSWDTQSSLFSSRAADATMCDEPFGTRFNLENLGFTIYSTGNQADVESTPGAGFLRATLISRRDRVDQNPEQARRMVNVIRRSLAWMASRNAEEIADVMAIKGPELQSFLEVFRKFPHQYSGDGKFSRAQLVQTEIFFRHANPDAPGVLQYKLNGMIIDRWAGSKP